LYAGNREEPLNQLLVERGDLFRPVSGEMRIEVGDDEMGALKAVVLVLQVEEGAKEEAGSDKQEKRQDDLADDEYPRKHGARLTAGARGGAGIPVERRARRDASHADGRGQAEENRGRDGDCEREEEDVRVGTRAE